VPLQRRLYAGRWFDADTVGGVAHLPIQFHELWIGGDAGVVVRFGPPPSADTLYPTEIWELLCAEILTVLHERHPATARALVQALAQRLHAYEGLYQEGCFTLGELLELLAQRQQQLRLDTTPRRAPEYASWHLRSVVRALEQELKAATADEYDERGKQKGKVIITQRYRRGRGYLNRGATLAYSGDWWKRRGKDDPRLSEDAKQAKYPQDEMRAYVSEGMSPQNLALFLVSKRYAISDETVRKSLRRQPEVKKR